MNDSIERVSQTLQSAYDEQYTDEMTPWRELGGKFKADNILNVCGNRAISKVLECGAGEGSILKWLDQSSQFDELYAVEISNAGLRQIEKRNLDKLVEAQKFNGYELPYTDNAFDMAYCSHVIEHVEHPRLLLREIKRVSKYQVFEIPIDYSIQVDERVKEFLSYGHINIYTPSLFKFLLRSEGFNILEELSTQIDKELIRFNLYENRKLKKTILRELVINLQPVKHFLRRLKLGKNQYRENGYAAYTCLAESVGSLEIF